MKIKVEQMLRITMNDSELSIVLDGLLSIAQREVSGHPEADVATARRMHDKLKDAWRGV